MSFIVSCIPPEALLNNSHQAQHDMQCAEVLTVRLARRFFSSTTKIDLVLISVSCQSGGPDRTSFGMESILAESYGDDLRRLGSYLAYQRYITRRQANPKSLHFLAALSKLTKPNSFHQWCDLSPKGGQRSRSHRLELGSVWSRLGAEVTVVEFLGVSEERELMKKQRSR